MRYMHIRDGEGRGLEFPCENLPDWGRNYDDDSGERLTHVVTK